MKNAMANPRKFSEKIALIKQKEAEGDAAFHQILNEVSAVTKDPGVPVPFRKHLPQLYATYKAGSLPDINHSAVHSQNHGSTGIDLKGAIDEFHSLNSRDVQSPRQQSRRQNLHGYAPVAARNSRCRTVEPHVPYPPYLSPPPLPGPEWRRFKSDSDIHERLKQLPPAPGGLQQHSQSAAVAGSGDVGMSSGNGGVLSPLMHRRVLEVGSGVLIPGDHLKNYASRPKSCGEYPVLLNNNLPYPPSPDLLMNGQHPHQMLIGGGIQMPNSPGSAGPATPPTLNNNYGSLPDLTNIQLSSSPTVSSELQSGGRYVNTSMPPPDSPSQLRHNPFSGSPTHKQSMPMNLNLPYSYPAAVAAGATASSPGSSIGKQLINETIRRRISDKRLAQASLNHFRNSHGDAASPVSPHAPNLCSPDGSSGSPGSSPHDLFAHMFYAMQSQQSSPPSLHQPSQHSPLQAATTTPPQAPPQPLSHQAAQQQHQQQQHQQQQQQHQQQHHQQQQQQPQQVPSVHQHQYEQQFKMETQMRHHHQVPGAGHNHGLGYAMGAPSPGDIGSGSSQFPLSMSPMYGGGGNYSSSSCHQDLGSGGDGGLGGGGHHLALNSDGGLLRHMGLMHKRIPNIVLTGVDESLRHDYFKDMSCSIIHEGFDPGELFPTDEQFKAELAPLDLEGLQMLDDPSNLVTDPNTEDQLRLG